MGVRNIVRIDEKKCTGCGLCATACAEGAIQIINGKARLVSDSYCDGLGACLGHCPEGAITIEQREADEFDEEAVKAYLGHAPAGPALSTDSPAAKSEPSAPPFVCPGLAMQQFTGSEPAADDDAAEVPSHLGHWPVQLKLVSPTAPYFANADLLLAADCVPFAMGDFHRRFLKGRSVTVGCPKLDDVQFYIEKLAQIVKSNNLRSLTVVHMEVPCCSGLTRVARESIARAGKPMSFQDVTVSLRGGVIRSETVRMERIEETMNHA